MITPPKNIEIKKTQQKGWGVYATENIKKGQVIERCYCIYVSDLPSETNSALLDYAFNYPKGMDVKDGAKHCIPLGYGCIYNHDNEPNAKWDNCELEMFFDFIAIKDIKPGEEICTYYGKDYWPQKKLRDEK